MNSTQVSSYVFPMSVSNRYSINTVEDSVEILQYPRQRTTNLDVKLQEVVSHTAIPEMSCQKAITMSLPISPVFILGMQLHTYNVMLLHVV